MSTDDRPARRTGRTGVIVMAYGTPRSADEILPYYTDIRRGRPPTDEQLADLTRRYEAIGGLSPLAHRTEAQRDALQRALHDIAPDTYEVAIGLKHADPKIEAAIDDLAARGIDDVVALVLAPHYSAFSVGQYVDRARSAAGHHGLAVAAVESWATEPAFVEFLVEDLRTRLADAPSPTQVVFTAHSLPERILESADPYPEQLHATATAVAVRLGLEEGRDWSIAWQSAGRTPEPWLAPDILTVIDEVASRGEVKSVITCACGFVADHLEVLYDLDIEARDRAGRLGLAFDRTACVNDDAAVMAALARRVDGARRAT